MHLQTKSLSVCGRKGGKRGCSSVGEAGAGGGVKSGHTCELRGRSDKQKAGEEELSEEPELGLAGIFKK